MHKFWYNHIKKENVNVTKLCYIDTDSFKICIKPGSYYKDIKDDAEGKFNSSNYEVKLLPLIDKDKKGFGMMKTKLGGVVIKEFGDLSTKIYSYIKSDVKVNK